MCSVQNGKFDPDVIYYTLSILVCSVYRHATTAAYNSFGWQSILTVFVHIFFLYNLICVHKSVRITTFNRYNTQEVNKPRPYVLREKMCTANSTSNAFSWLVSHLDWSHFLFVPCLFPTPMSVSFSLAKVE